MNDETSRLLTRLLAQAVMRRHFLYALLRRLALDVPALDLELLQEHLYQLVESAPHKPRTAPAEFQSAGHAELEALIAMVEQVIEETRQE